MPIGMQNVTNITLDQLQNLSNSSEPIDFLVGINNTAYGGIFVFVALWVVAIILYIAAQDYRDQPLNNAMYAMAICSILAIFARVLEFLSDHQMWVFPLLTIFLVALIWAIKRTPD